MDRMDLAGRVALVTGGAQGIGEACATLLATHGAAVLVADINLEGAARVAKALRAGGHDARAAHVDVAQAASVTALVAGCVQHFGRVDILVNNAGVIDRTPCEELDAARWDEVLAINLRGAQLLCGAVLPLMQAAGGGRIVNVASLAGRVAGQRTSPAYVASKAGLIGLTKSYALHYAKHNINVNAVAPGLIVTPTTEGRNRAEDVPMGRLGRPEDIAGAVLFLALPMSGYITGQTIDVNGGLYMG